MGSVRRPARCTSASNASVSWAGVNATGAVLSMVIFYHRPARRGEPVQHARADSVEPSFAAPFVLLEYLESQRTSHDMLRTVTS